MEHKAWPYLAGIIDSEGTICIALGSQQRKSGDFRPHTKLVIGVDNTDVRLMKWLVANFGGTYRNEPNNQGFSSPNGMIYHWGVPGAKQEEILQNLLPYLVLKKAQAQVALDYLRIGLRWAVDERVVLAKECQKLNHTFPDDLSDASHLKPAPYLAGFMDGDGSFFVARATLSPQVSVTSKSFRMIRWLMANFGGRFTVNLRNAAYQWRVSGKANKERFVLTVLPYLMLKRKQAQIVLTLVRMSYEHVREKREQLADECCVLNNLKSTVTTDTPSTSNDVKIQSVLTGDCESDPVETLDS